MCSLIGVGVKHFAGSVPPPASTPSHLQKLLQAPAKHTFKSHSSNHSLLISWIQPVGVKLLGKALLILIDLPFG